MLYAVDDVVVIVIGDRANAGLVPTVRCSTNHCQFFRQQRVGEEISLMTMKFSGRGICGNFVGKLNRAEHIVFWLHCAGTQTAPCRPCATEGVPM